MRRFSDSTRPKSHSELQTLRLHDTQITGAGLGHIEGLTKLERLSLNNTKISDAGVADLFGQDQSLQVSQSFEVH